MKACRRSARRARFQSAHCRGKEAHIGEPPTVFDVTDEHAEGDAIAEAEADVAAGRTVAHATVVQWLSTLGTDGGAIRHG